MSKKLAAAVCFVGVIATFFMIWSFVLDTSTHREMVADEIQSLVDAARVDATRKAAVDELLVRANGDYNFEATYATAALGDVGDAAIPRVNEIASLLESSNPFVRREAARSLGKLGPRSAPVLDALKRKVASDSPTGDDKWFAAEAIGEIGEPAIDCLPLLRSKLGSGAPQFDDCLIEAIKKLEAAKNLEESNESSLFDGSDGRN